MKSTVILLSILSDFVLQNIHDSWPLYYINNFHSTAIQNSTVFHVRSKAITDYHFGRELI